MRILPLLPHAAPAKIDLPDLVDVYESALDRLVGSHESEAAELLARCTLEIVPTGGVYPLCEQLQPVKAIVAGPTDAISKLEQSPEIRGRVRQALDSALGSTLYLTQMVIRVRTSALAA
jgi:hypothetical protein